MPGVLKLDRLLNDADRAELAQLIVHPGTTTAKAWKWVREREYDVSASAVYAYILRHHPDKTVARRFSKLEKILKPKDRAMVEGMLLEPSTTASGLHEVLKSRGYDISRVTVGRDVRRWREELLDVKRCSRFARSLCQVAKDVGPGTFSGGAMLGFEQVILERVFQLRQKQEVGARDLTDWATMLERAISVREQVETMRRKSERADRDPEAVNENAPAKPRVVNGVEIANCVRRILGVPLPGEPVPDGPVLPLLPPPPHVAASDAGTEHTEPTENTEERRDLG